MVVIRCYLGLTILASVHCWNILILAPFAFKSHKNALDPIAEELGMRGHQVTLVSPIKDTREMKGVRNVHLTTVEELFHQYAEAISFFQPPNTWSMGMKFVEMGIDVCNATYREPEIRDLLLHPRNSSTGRPRYDVAIIDSVMNDFMHPLAYYLGIPTVYVSPALLYPAQAWVLNIPAPSSYVPVGTKFMVSGKMDIFDRMSNFLEGVFSVVFWHHYLFPIYERMIRDYFIPSFPPLIEMESNVSFVITNTHPAINPRRPTTPHFIELGCLQCRPPTHLSKDLQDYLDNSGNDGVIYFSLGSATKGNTMPNEMKQKFIETFSKLPQRILWKYEGDIAGLSPNVKLIKWAPQQDIIAHSKVRLFISHGGGLSTLEAAYHGCPILGFPLNADQLGHMASVADRGMAEYLMWDTFTVQELLDKIRLMLEDSRYRANSKEISARMKDNPQIPVKRAAYWIEYVIRHNGAPHLRITSEETLNFFQYFLLDVMAAVALTLCVILGATIYTFTRCCRVLKAVNRTKVKMN